MTDKFEQLLDALNRIESAIEESQPKTIEFGVDTYNLFDFMISRLAELNVVAKQIADTLEKQNGN
jgi:hypothetical protein